MKESQEPSVLTKTAPSSKKPPMSRKKKIILWTIIGVLSPWLIRCFILFTKQPSKMGFMLNLPGMESIRYIILMALLKKTLQVMPIWLFPQIKKNILIILKTAY